MRKKIIDLAPYRVEQGAGFRLSQIPTKIGDLYDNKDEYEDLLEDFKEEIDELQSMMYAHDRYSMLLIFQAMDAAGKDGTIRHVISGVNPHGVSVHAFKRPSDEELDHDFLWRTTKELPQRGRIGIFNRSYYEEVLVVRVHPGILTDVQRVPAGFIDPIDQVWDQRLEDIRHFERFLHRNGTRVVKFFLNISKEEQRQRFLERLNTPSKNWKFAEGDLKERARWDDYMTAYEAAIQKSATPDSPWYVIPADDKKNMRLMVSQAILDQLHQLDMHYPTVDEAREAEFEAFRQQLGE